MSSRTRLIVLAISAPVIAFAIGGGFLAKVMAREDTYQHLKVFDDVATLITNNYVEEVKADKAASDAVRRLDARGEQVMRERRLFIKPAALLPVDAEVYLCGPAGFMDAMTVALTDLGVPAGRVHTERFTSLAAINPGVVAAARPGPHAPTTPGTGPMITFARAGLTVAFDEACASLLEMAEACDVPTRWSCRTGVCHTCATPLLAGAVSYSPPPLTEPDAGQVLLALLFCQRVGADEEKAGREQQVQGERTEDEGVTARPVDGIEAVTPLHGRVCSETWVSPSNWHRSSTWTMCW